MIPRRRAPRGQAVVETVLGVTIVTTVILIGIFFAEIGYWSLKLQEGLNFALWDATGRTLHLTPSSYSPYSTAVSAAESRAQNVYGDYDGVRSRGSGTMSQVVTKIAPPTFSCTAGAGPGVGPLGIGPTDATGFPNLASAMPGAVRAAGLRCNAKAAMRGYQIPRAFLKDQPYHADHFDYRSSPMTICAIGRANSAGNCVSSLPMLLDDWGLSTSAEGNECHLAIDASGTCANTHYYDWVRGAFGSASGGGQGLTAVVGSDSVNEGQFFMSYRGYESNYVESLDEETGTVQWETSPYQNPGGGVSYAINRFPYWLGNKLKPVTLH